MVLNLVHPPVQVMQNLLIGASFVFPIQSLVEIMMSRARPREILAKHLGGLLQHLSHSFCKLLQTSERAPNVSAIVPPCFPPVRVYVT